MFLQSGETQDAASPSKFDEASAGESLISGLSGLWDNLLELDPSEVLINLALSVLVIALVAGAVWGLRKLLHLALARLSPHPPAPDAAPKIAGVTWGLVRLLALAAAATAVLGIWGVDIWAWLTRGSGLVLFRIALIVVAAAAVSEIAGYVIDRTINAAERRSSRPHRAAQLRTIRPLIRGFVQLLVVGLAALTVLSELGVQIGPLLASAGVVGIAIGFGAQTLVKDFLTGIFLIMEDIVAVGDNVRIGERSGTVEAMTLRTIRLRNLDGTLHILPYSEAQVIDNRTKSYSSYVVEVGVGYRTDIDEAFAVMRQVGEDLRADAEFGELVERPLEILGLDGFGDNAIMLKARIRTRPGEQWKVGREYNKRLKAAFDANGIEFPFPQRTISIDPESATMLQAAAQEAAVRPSREPRTWNADPRTGR
ncbi:mechanosensitive ion channel family protein [Phenylobacterium sp.]|jgi:small conductance mechanosensitive channel|uniref:mechanosensitive ion channel family protein n=1 Tax=Phenylobacterium sp. TaxID=1871053 RepID=UPI002E37609F|nr:mechanosensitive ion channel family protein [Phenylobacterium sp.]HEX2559801.1 mechanosensitive ion channel family protein [Phenylobacterium sp.]